MRWSAEIGAGAVRNPVPVSDRQVLEPDWPLLTLPLSPSNLSATGRGSMAECIVREPANPEMPALMYV